MPLNIDFQQVLLHLFNVCLLFAILYFLLYKPVRDFMDKRAEGYRQMKSEAEQTVKQAQEKKAEYEARLLSVNDEIDSMRAQAREELARQQQLSRQNAEKAAADILQRAKVSAQEEKAKIVEEARAEITDMVKEAAEKLISESTGEAYDEFLATVGGKEADA